MFLAYPITFVFLIITAISILLLGVLSFLNNRQKLVNKVFLIMTVSTVLWILSVALRFNTGSPSLFVHSARMSYATAAILGFIINYFCYCVPQKNNYKFPLIIGSVCTILVALLSLFTPYIIRDIKLVDGAQENVFGRLFFAFIIFFPLNVIWGAYNLLSKRRFLDQLGKLQTNFILVGVFLSTTFGFSTNVIIPLAMRTSATESYGPLSTIIFILFAAYAIFKHHLFSVRVIATEIFALIICVVLLIKILLSNGLDDYLINGGIFIAAVIFGLLLVRSVIHEVEQKNKIEAMADDISRAYEVEKKARQELERLGEAKSQFLMATQHHLRTPLTIVKGYLSMVIEGDFGRVNVKVKEKMALCLEAVERLIKLANEFLDISKMQLGHSIINPEKVLLSDLLTEVFKEVSPEAEGKGISLEMSDPGKFSFEIFVDPMKFKEALFNIIDNAVKYTEKGGIKVNVELLQTPAPKSFRIIITDTGIGMTAEETKSIFNRQFERGRQAKSVYTLGRGIGLFIAAQIIAAHKGKVWAQSDGPGKGSIFYIELPLL